jgi:hypothetical protein
MREEPVRRRRRASDELEPARSGHRLVLVLGLVAVVMVALVVVRYWPEWIGESARQAADAVLARGSQIWTETGGRWVTLTAVVGAIAVGALLLRRSRTLGLVIIEVAVAAGAIVALVQPAGW